jgi:hypothetical protein
MAVMPLATSRLNFHAIGIFSSIITSYYTLEHPEQMPHLLAALEGLAGGVWVH